MIKYYRVLRKLSQKVFLLGKHGGTLLFKKSMPFLFVATMSGLLYLLCLKLGAMDFFQSLLSKAGVSMGCRALCSFVFKIECSGALALAIGFAVKALLATEAAPYLANMVLPAGAEASVNQAPGRNDAGPSNAGPSNVVPADSPLRSFPSVPSSLTPIPSDPSVPSVPSLPSLEENNLFGREQSVEQPAPPQPPALPDDTKEPHNQIHGYWFAHRILIDYLKADMDTSFDRTPSYRKYQRVLELLAGQHYKSKARLVELLGDIAKNPAENPTRERARQMMDDIFQKEVKDQDLYHYQFNDNAGQSF